MRKGLKKAYEITDANLHRLVDNPGDVVVICVRLDNSAVGSELDNVSKQETSERKGLLKQLAAALGLNVVEKGAMAELYEERSKGTLFWNAFNSLEEILYKYDPITSRWMYETNELPLRS